MNRLALQIIVGAIIATAAIISVGMQNSPAKAQTQSITINQGLSKDTTITVQPETRVAEPYNRSAAATWALNHAMDVRGNMFADCTWFISQALWAGGLHQTSTWNSYQGRQGAVLSQPGTDTARGAPNLASYLQQRFPVTIIPLNSDRFQNGRVPEAQPGDIIAYIWNVSAGTALRPQNNYIESIDHLALVTSITPGQYPEVSEWGTVPVRESYQKRGWTWSDLDHAWLQTQTPNITAILIHFNLPN